MLCLPGANLGRESNAYQASNVWMHSIHQVNGSLKLADNVMEVADKFETLCFSGLHMIACYFADLMCGTGQQPTPKQDVSSMYVVGLGCRNRKPV
jgi:hypothetical protein